MRIDMKIALDNTGTLSRSWSTQGCKSNNDKQYLTNCFFT
jgi:hypothetical protein